MAKFLIFIISIFLFLLFSQGIILSAENVRTTWRCGDSLISVGDHKMDVLAKCGEPTVKEAALYSEHGDLLSEDWAYNCGDNGFNTYLSFSGSQLRKITIGGYGKGESYCNGADENPNNKISTTSFKISDEENAFIKAKTEQAEEETYQMRMKVYDDRIKALNEESEKAAAAHAAIVKQQQEENTKWEALEKTIKEHANGQIKTEMVSVSTSSSNKTTEPSESFKVYFNNGKALDCEKAWQDGDIVYVVRNGKNYAIGYDINEIDISKTFK